MFTEEQQALIDFCKATGYGWAKFAESVESQGKCSTKQELTLQKMKSIISHKNKYKYSTGGDGYHDISDNEAMSMGEYF